MSTCRCGHQIRHHDARGGKCRGSALTPDGYGGLGVPFCSCAKLEDALLPEPGEKPVFGVHRLPSAEAAWTTEPEAERERRFREWVKGAPGDQA